MDKQTLETIKKNLLEQKAALEKELAGFAVKDPEIRDNYKSKFPEYGSDEEENAAEVATYGDNLSIEHELEDKLQDVNKALASIENGTYGVCKYCGQEIGQERLMVRPISTSCVECKKKLKGER